MNYCESNFNQALGSYSLEDRSTGIKVGTLTHGNLTEQRSSLIGMALAKFSRSNKPFIDNVAEIHDSSAAMERVAVGYGHSSVADMAQVNFHAEDVSILDSLLFFYENVLIAGQERSTRYQDFDRFIAVPSTIGSNSLRNEYKNIVRKQLSDYNEAYEVTFQALKAAYPNASESIVRARTLDCTRYLIPLATKTSFGCVTSARSLAHCISGMKTSLDPVQTRISDLLMDLFIHEDDIYRSECSFLLRHTDSSESIKPILSVLEEVDLITLERSIPGAEPHVEAMEDPFSIGHAHLVKLLDSSILNQVPLDEHTEAALANVLCKYDHHSQAPSFLKEGFLNLYGFADIGSIKDLNRHRSLHKLVPFLHESTSLMPELVDRPLNRRYFICPYLNHNSKLMDLSDYYCGLLNKTYKAIENWYVTARGSIGIYADLYGKRLVPHAHATTYVYSGSYPELSYMFNLRTRPGGHIQYRMLTYQMLETLCNSSYGHMFKPLKAKIKAPSPLCEEEFIDRS